MSYDRRVLAAADSHLDAVEALMRELCTGQGPDLAGGIASEHLATGGKRLRARLALAATAALSGRTEDAVGWAAACELLHNATLIHDDIEDGDRARRGHPTAWVRHGVGQAINAGDLLFLLPFLAVERTPAPPDTRVRLHHALARGGSAVIRGQAAEMSLTSSRRVAREDYTEAIRGKTSALFELPAVGAAMLAGVDPAPIAPPFAELGVLFQLQDDVLDCFGDKGRGTLGSDLFEGKVSALVVEHLERHPADTQWLLELLARPRDETPQSEVDRALRRFRDGGALDAACRRIEQIASGLRDAPELGSSPRLQALLTELVAAVLGPIAGVLAGR